MKLSIAFLGSIAFPLAALAQNLSGEPACATSCLSSAITAAGCAPTDQACQCGPTQTSIGVLAATCLVANCPASLISTIQSIGLALCSEFSSHLTMTSMGSSSGSGTTVVIGTISGSGVSVKTATTTGSTTAVVSSSGTASESSSETESTSASGTGSSSKSGSTATTTSGGTSSTASGSGAPATTSTSAAAIMVLASGPGVIAALFLGLVALL